MSDGFNNDDIKREVISIAGRKLGYARVSTLEQCIDLQINALNVAGCDVIYQDKGVTGVADDKPGLDQLLETIAPGDTLVVWKLDRLGRSLASLISLLNALMQRNIAFCSLRDLIDTSTAGGKLYFHIMGALAEFERDLISERTKAGMIAARKRGSKIGRPPKLSASDIELAQHHHMNGMSIDDIAHIFGVHSRTIDRCLLKSSLND